jgi:hypothetical protein
LEGLERIAACGNPVGADDVKEETPEKQGGHST